MFMKTDSATPTSSWIQWWAIFGVSFILAHAIWNLVPLAAEPFIRKDLNIFQWFFGGIWILFMGYTEGYRGFQKAFCPRVVSRAFTLTSASPKHHIILAPLYSMGYFYATRKRKTISWCITFAIVGIVLFVKLLEYPYRHIIDGGVVIGLSYGLGVLIIIFTRTLLGIPIKTDPDLPESHKTSV